MASVTSRSWSAGRCRKPTSQALLDIGVAAVFPTGTPIETLVAEVRRITSGDTDQHSEPASTNGV